MWVSRTPPCRPAIPRTPGTAEPAQHVDERPGEPAIGERLYRLWIAGADQSRRELGQAPA